MRWTATSGTDVVRLSIPGRAVAFGRQDEVRPGFEAAVRAAGRLGFEPVLRLAGGRAAVFHEGTVAVSISFVEERPRETIHERFVLVAQAIADAIRSVGSVAVIGELPGEYCPGRYSIHDGARKVAGLGQRLGRSSAHVGGVVVVEDSGLINEVLIPIYEHLDYDWNPRTTGAVSTTSPTSPAEMIDAIAAALRARDWEMDERALPPEVVEAAADAGAHVLGDTLA